VGARSEQRNTRVNSEGRLQEERERERQSSRNEWTEGKSAGYCLSAIKKRR
jgi:hypothetical protein